MSVPEFPVIENPDETVTLTRREAVNLAIHAQRGAALEAWIANTALLGHARPGNTLDYVHNVEPWTADAFVHDFVAWTSGREKFAPGCADRLREWGMHEAGIRAGRVAEALGIPTAPKKST